MTTKVLLVVGFLVAFGAGVVIGLELRQPAQATTVVPATRPTGPGSFLTAELGLSPDQQEQMKKIWSETAHRGGREQDDRRRQSRKERDDAILALVRPEDRPKYDAVVQAYLDRQAEMEKEWRASFQTAVEKTKRILTPEQGRKYEDFLKKREAERGSRPEHDSNRRAEGRATSRPASEK
jgi:uncharacterized membrane protein